MQGTRNLASTCKETILFAMTCGNRYSHEDMQGNDTPCEEVCANDTMAYRRYAYDKRSLSVPRGDVTNDTVTRTRKGPTPLARTCGERYPHENIQQAIPVGSQGEALTSGWTGPSLSVRKTHASHEQGSKGSTCSHSLTSHPRS